MVLACYGSAAGLGVYQPLAQDVRAALPGVPVRLAVTSGPMRRALEARGEEAATLPEAITVLAAEGASRVVVQPVLVAGGHSLDEVRSAAAASAVPGGPNVVLAPELLASPADARHLASLLSCALPARPDAAVLLVAHGGEGWDRPSALLAEALAELGRADVLIATLHDGPDAAVARLRDSLPRVRRVTLASLMLAEGSHARRQLWGNAAGAPPATAARAPADKPAGRPTGRPSWRDRLCACGYDVSMRTEGLLHLAGVRRMFVEHTTGALAAPGE